MHALPRGRVRRDHALPIILGAVRSFKRSRPGGSGDVAGPIAYTWAMRSWLALSVVVACVGCSQTTSPEKQPSPRAAEEPAAPVVSTAPAEPDEITGPLRFVWTHFHFEMGGTAVLEIRDRSVRDLFPDSRQARHEGERVTEMFFRLATYELSADEAAALRDAVTSREFLALEPRHVNSDIKDGATQTFTVSIGDHEQHVYCYQQWPPPIVRVKEQIRAIQDAHRSERESAPEAPVDVAAEMRKAVAPHQ